MANQPLNSSITQQPPTVSVIMNCLNSAKYLREAIDSVFTQIYTDWEIIFWDNASTDNSAEIAKSYGEKIRYFKSDKTYPLGKARNLAIEKARGKYIAFLDCDDIWLPEKLARQIPLFESNPDVGLVFSDGFISNTLTGRKSRYFENVKPYRSMVKEQLFLRNFVPLLTVIVRKSVIDKAGEFNPQYTIVEEYDLFLRIARLVHFDYVNEPLARYLVHEDNLSRNIELALTEKIQVLTKYWNKDKKLRVTIGMKGRRCLSNLYSARGRLRCLKGKTSEARADFKVAIRWSLWLPGPYIYWLLALMGKSPMTWLYTLKRILLRKGYQWDIR